jgi:SAM-dependent methyltransferase
MQPKHDKAVDAFNRDVATRGGYHYTTNGRLSSIVANRRQSDAILAAAEYGGRKVLDVGCGDGTYTVELFDEAGPSELHGVDPAEEAIGAARRRTGGRPVHFGVESAHKLSYPDNRFDVVTIRGVLHHMDEPREAIREALRVASTVVILEPNGYNPVLKLIEKTSRYHVEHGEKSYAPHRLKRWIGEQGGQVLSLSYIGLVPFFCPDWMVKVLRRLAPMFEAVPLLRAVSCGNSVIVARRRGRA